VKNNGHFYQIEKGFDNSYRYSQQMSGYLIRFSADSRSDHYVRSTQTILDVSGTVGGVFAILKTIFEVIFMLFMDKAFYYSCVKHYNQKVKLEDIAGLNEGIIKDKENIKSVSSKNQSK